MSASELQQWVENVTRVLLVDSVLPQVEALVRGEGSCQVFVMWCYGFFGSSQGFVVRCCCIDSVGLTPEAVGPCALIEFVLAAIFLALCSGVGGLVWSHDGVSGTVLSHGRLRLQPALAETLCFVGDFVVLLLALSVLSCSGGCSDPFARVCWDFTVP